MLICRTPRWKMIMSTLASQQINWEISHPVLDWLSGVRFHFSAIVLVAVNVYNVFVFKRKRDHERFCFYFQRATPLHEIFAWNFVQLLNNTIYTLLQIFVKIYIWKWHNYTLSTEKTPNQFLSLSIVMQNLLQANSLGFIETPQICTCWTTTSGMPCWKSKIIPSRSLRWLMSWKSPCKPSGKSCHKNTSTRRWRTSPSAWLPTWLWLPIVVKLSICSNSASSSHHHQIGSFQRHQQTTGE